MDIAAAKDLARRYWAASDAGDVAAVSGMLAADVTWDGPWPCPPCTTPSQVAEVWVTPLARAFPQMRRRYHILMAGLSSGRADGGPDGRLWVGATGTLDGVAQEDVFGIPRTDAPLSLRWGEFLRIDEAGHIAEIQVLIDFVDWFEQIGRPVLPPSRGVPGVWPAATAFDAVMSGPVDAATTEASLQLGRDLIFGGLNTFDEANLASMGMRRFFHPNLKWYGPGGIGACLSLEEFEVLHQKPWLDAFPDRKVQDLPSLFAEGRMVAGSGPAGVLSTHTGTFRDVPASGNRLEVSGLDFWLRTGDVFTENWVFVDMVKMFSQMGVDLMDRMRTAR